MAGLKLDGAGQAKMASLEEAQTILQRANAAVENFALAVKRNQPTGTYMTNYKRQMPALASKLKGQFGMIADLVTAVSMASTRGASDQMRVRAMREGMAAIKVQVEIAVAQTIAKHEAKE